MTLHNYLIKLKQTNNFNHSLILETIYCCDYKNLAHDYLKTLICLHKIPFCNECIDCNRINTQNYVDFIYIDNNIDTILKDDTIQIKDKFLNQASESAGIKLYVIKNLEKANKFVLNSLLKFIEEPPKNTYALFITNNSNLIIDTIRSRSEIIHIDNKCDWADLSIDIPETILNNVFYDFNEFKYYVQEYKIADIFILAKKIVQINNIEQEVSYANSIKELTKNEFNLLLRFILVLVNPLQRIAIQEIIEKIKLNINKRTLIHKLFNTLK